ncbi:MAG: hypothetical protein GTO03_03735 [Planctomycetales bacterium]|nr:hypothetical protein [Planctomycetales bacterium]
MTWVLIPAWRTAGCASLAHGADISLGAGPKSSLGSTGAPTLGAALEANLDAILTAITRLLTMFLSGVPSDPDALLAQR